MKDLNGQTQNRRVREIKSEDKKRVRSKMAQVEDEEIEMDFESSASNCINTRMPDGMDTFFQVRPLTYKKNLDSIQNHTA